MLVHRDVVSSHALDRFIRARLLVAHGLDCPYLTHEVPIVPRSATEDGRNWDIDADALPPEYAAEILQAATDAAKRLNLRRQRVS